MSGKKVYKSGYASLIGKPNVGKSTLLNELVSVKIAATADKPQTTRNRITGVCHFPDGQIVLVDTPGIHESAAKLNRMMVKTSLSALSDVDVVLFLIDAKNGVTEEDEYALKQLELSAAPKILVLNKIDLIPKPMILPLIGSLSKRKEFAEIVPISALHNDGLDVLVRVIFNILPEGPPYFPEDMVTDSPERFLVGEIIREKVIRLTRCELPYATAVVVDHMGAGEKEGVTAIDATIFAEKESQKKILIGEKGSMLKKIGALARQEIERRFGGRVYLKLHIKIKESWRESDFYLKEFGYTGDTY